MLTAQLVALAKEAIGFIDQQCEARHLHCAEQRRRSDVVGMQWAGGEAVE